MEEVAPVRTSRNRSVPNESLIEVDESHVHSPADPSLNKRSSRHLLRRTNSNDSIFAPPPSSSDAPAPVPERRKPQRPSQSSKPAYPVNNRMSVYATSSGYTADLPKPRPRHHRSNSDSSVMDVPDDRRRTSGTRKSSRTHEQRERDREAERRHREKYGVGSSHSSSRHQDLKDKKSSSSRRKKGAPLDTIDRLDVTGFFGPGNFHHDGPFDACTPHRNKHTKKAPVAAYAVDGPNNSVSGIDPNRDRFANENQVLARADNEAFQDFSVTKPGRSLPKDNFDPHAKVNPIHGYASAGLGSTTFLDGAPASRQEAVAAQATQQQQGLGRKKSLVQRLRGGNGPGPAVNRQTYVESRSPTSPRASSVGVDRKSPIGVPVSKEVSPGGEGVTWASGERSPRSGEDATPPKSSGLLRRVKSLKVGSSRR